MKGRESRMFCRLKHRMEIMEILGNKCANPYNIDHGGFSNIKECLQIDHIHGGGTNQRRKITSYDAYYAKILKELKAGSKDYQLLCANCNWLKRDREGE